ncbi:MAG: mechanosensitive ion channel domain-containing protein [Alphaproteobacteria bacterium]
MKVTGRAAPWRRVIAVLALACVLLMGGAALGPALAQVPQLPEALTGGGEQAGPQTDTEAAAGQVTVKDLEALLSTLETPAERDKLAAQLRALIAAKKQVPEKEQGVTQRFLDLLSERIGMLSAEVTAAAAALVDAPELFRWLGRQVQDEYSRQRAIEILTKLAIVLGAGLGAAALARMALARPRRLAERGEHVSRILRWLLLLVRTLLEIAPTVIFAAACYLVLPLTDPSHTTKAIALAVVNAVVLVRVVMAAAFLILSPASASLRLLPFSDETTQYAYIWVRRLATLAIYGYFAAHAALLLGLSKTGYATVLNVLGLVMAVMLAILVLQNRSEVAAWIRGEAAGGRIARFSAVQSLRRLLADLWHILTILYVLAIYLVWALRIEGGFEFVFTATVLTVATLVIARLAVVVTDQAIARGFSVGEELRDRFPTLESRLNRYLPILNVVTKVVVYGLAALVLLQVWGIGAVGWVTSDLGRRLTATVITIALALAGGLAFWEFASLYIESYLSRAEAAGEPEERRARIRTLLPVLRTTLLVFLVAMVSLIVLAQIGINIAPLLAGAGIVGLAIGFGAQKLVQDIFTGLFVFLEASVAVGDVVELGGHEGIVETMSIRSIRLRDLEGNVHTIPFSAVSTVMNRTKVFSYYMFDIGIGYGESVDRAIQTMREVGQGMCDDKEFRRVILEPLEVLGLDRFADSAVMIKARIKTLPGRQWMVGREFNRRLKMRFDELGIEIPFPQRTITFGGANPFAAEAKAEGGPSRG